MAGFVRTKRVSDPLDGRVRDRLVGRDQNSELRYASSGSEHSGSPCLSELVHGFLEDEDNESETRHFPDHDSESDRSDSASDRFLTAESLSSSNADPYRSLLLAHVAAAAREVSTAVQQNKAAFRRRVMAYLRELGHNAAICKTRWEASPGGSVSAGSYEFIDAVDRRSNKRFFVDLDFAAEFQIARPSPHYSRLFQSLPRCFVGDGDDLRRIVREMCDAAKRSLRITELSLPPWRKNRYMQAKWFGPYRRTTNPVPESSLSTAALSAVKSRCVGFDGGAVNVSVNCLVRTK